MNVSLERICTVIGAACPPGMETFAVRGVASLEDAGPEDISFLANQKYARHLSSTHAKAVIVHSDCETPSTILALRVSDPYMAFLKVLVLFNTRHPDIVAKGVHPLAFIHPEAHVGNDVSVGQFASIAEGVTVGDGTTIGSGTVVLSGSTIGKGCLLYPNVTVMDGCLIGDRVIIHSGTVIGSDGFGFAPFGGKYHKIPQIGTVRIGDDVEIGANTTIDRAAFGTTVIESGVKIDNLVQIAHNVRVASHTVIAAQVGISGSTKIGSWVRLGGQAGLQGHITVGDGASAGGQAGVTKDIPPGETVSGYPAKPHMEAMRLEAALRRVPELLKKVREQERRIMDLEKHIRERS